MAFRKLSVNTGGRGAIMILFIIVFWKTQGEVSHFFPKFTRHGTCGRYGASELESFLQKVARFQVNVLSHETIQGNCWPSIYEK